MLETCPLLKLRRPSRLALVCVVLAGLAVALCTIWYPTSRITPDNSARIELGMTVAEVEAILGPPDASPEEDEEILFWTGQNGYYVGVMFNTEGKACLKRGGHA